VSGFGDDGYVMTPVTGAKTERGKRGVPGGDRDKLKKCGQLVGDKDRPLAVVANAIAFIKAFMPDHFAFDEFARTVRLLKSPAGDDKSFSPRELTDVDSIFVQERLQLAGLEKLSNEVTRDAIAAAADGKRVHPVREFLESLEWDGQARLQDLFPVYFGSERTPYTEEVGAMFLTAMAARIFAPGCKHDHMPVIEGPQGALKSTACRILGEPWFSDALPDLREGKDVSQHLRGVWLCEVAELHALDKARTTQLKAFISRQVERYRPSYGRREVEERRQVSFVGTTNKSAYLRDETGGRRFWPIVAGEINIDALARDRRQLLAEAVASYHGGFRWWPSREFEARTIRPQQDARFEADAWSEPIGKHLAGMEKATVGEIAADALDIPKARLGTAEQRRIAAILSELGWRRLPKDSQGKRYWGPPA